MLRTALVLIVLFVALSTSSSSIIRRKLIRRQSDPAPCNAIEGFECKCSYYRVTCTTDRELPSSITIVPSENQKYQSVELVISAARDIHVNEHTFAPVKDLYKPDGDNFEFRIKFEKFTALHLSSPGIFNRVFPDNLPSNARKYLAVEIHSPDVRPEDNPGLFQNLNADSLELYALHPFHGTFNQLFQGANIKYIRLSGGDIRSDVSEPFTGNIGRLELAKQATVLSVQNFPVYPVHELVIDAHYVTEFNNENPANYANLGELRVNSQENIPANAFRQYPDIRTLSVHSDKDIDPRAFDGLTKLEKLTIKDTRMNADLLSKLPNVKELETNIEKLEPDLQCKLMEKLANGQVAVQAIPNGRECTCVSAYLDTAAGRQPCTPEHCEHSPCAAIKNNFDASTNTFKAPPPIRRLDGTDALRPRESRVYTAPFQVNNADQEKLQKGTPQQVQPPTAEEEDPQRPNNDDSYPRPPNPQDRNDFSSAVENNEYENPNSDFPPKEEKPWDYAGEYGTNNERQTTTTTIDDNQNPLPSETTIPSVHHEDQQGGHDHAGGGDHTPVRPGDDNRPAGDGNENESGTGDGQPGTSDGNREIEGGSVNGTDTTGPAKKGMSWLPIIIIVASIVGLLLIGLLVLFFRKRNANKNYNQAPTSEPRT